MKTHARQFRGHTEVTVCNPDGLRIEALSESVPVGLVAEEVLS